MIGPVSHVGSTTIHFVAGIARTCCYAGQFPPVWLPLFSYGKPFFMGDLFGVLMRLARRFKSLFRKFVCG